MKKVLFLLGILSFVSAYANESSFIRQIQTVNGNNIIYDIPITTDTGTINSFPLTAESTIFQLYTSTSEPGKPTTLTKLSEKTVGTILPTATVTIISEDPHSPPRTRADQPFEVQITVSGLLPNSPDTPAQFKTVHTTRSYQMYNPVTFQPNGVSGEYADEYQFRNNGNYIQKAVYQRLPGEKPTKVTGEESFTVSLHPAINVTAELAKRTIQIFPVATTEITGIEEGKTYTALPTLAKFSVKNAYPNSVTYAQLYQGAHRVGTVGTPLPTTVVAYNTHAPQSILLPLTELSTLITEDGTYTVEVVTITPFNKGAPEVLSSVTFTLDRTIRINGSFSTIE